MKNKRNPPAPRYRTVLNELKRNHEISTVDVWLHPTPLAYATVFHDVAKVVSRLADKTGFRCVSYLEDDNTEQRLWAMNSQAMQILSDKIPYVKRFMEYRNTAEPAEGITCDLCGCPEYQLYGLPPPPPRLCRDCIERYPFARIHSAG